MKAMKSWYMVSGQPARRGGGRRPELLAGGGEPGVKRLLSPLQRRLLAPLRSRRLVAATPHSATLVRTATAARAIWRGGGRQR